mgnify:CR=1 FL=1
MNWRPSPFLIGSGLFHLAVFALWAWHPEFWGVYLLALVANHAAITLAGLLPRCALLGENLTRLPEAAVQAGLVAITIDDGPDPEVTPRVLALLAAHGAKASFFCIGERLAAHPELAREIVAAGHAIENHGERHHALNSLKGPGGWRREVLDAQASIVRITGRLPRFYRPTAGLRNPFLTPVLQAHGLRLASWTRRGFDTRCTDPAQVLSRLTRDLAGGDILLLHDGNAARTASGEPLILEVLPRLLEAIEAAALRTARLDEAVEKPSAQGLSQA